MRVRSLLLVASLLSVSALVGCDGRTARPPVAEAPDLDVVVLYRNGVGYFERRGKVDGEVLHLKVRKDQVNDLLKSLTVVDEDGRAVSVSMPLDPQTWASAALAILTPGRGSLAQVLDVLRGTEVSVRAGNRIVNGRIVMVEEVINEPAQTSGNVSPIPVGEYTKDYKLTLLAGKRLEVVRLSKIGGLTLKDGDLAMQLNRRLDASAGEGMFEQVDVAVRLDGGKGHRVTVSYVVQAPMWKPTYRVVLPESGDGKALLQAWAVVDNISGEDWSDVSLSLTSGAPIAFRYDLHTPRDVYRSDLTEAGVHKQARVALGETSYGDEEEEEEVMEEAMAAPEPMPAASPKASRARKSESKKRDKGRGFGGAASGAYDFDDDEMAPGAPPPASEAPARGPSVDLDALRRSTAASARSKQVAGLTRVDLKDRVTVLDGTSTMVALINEQVDGEQTFLYKPGGAGPGYDSNPYRVVRFRNSTPYVLEPGPISIYSGGSFVGEGLSEAVGTDTSVTIPFAVEPGIVVTTSSSSKGDELRLVRLVRGVLEVENFYQRTTRYEVRTTRDGLAERVLVRHARYGSAYELQERPEGTEDLDGAYLIPVAIAQGKTEGTVEIIEQTPSRTSFAIWDGRALPILDQLLAGSELDAKARAKLQPIVDARRAVGKIDTEIDGLKRQQRELDQRASETRANLEAIKKDPRAGALRAKLSKRLDEFTREADAMGRKIVELNSRRLEQKIELDDMLENFEFRAPKRPSL